MVAGSALALAVATAAGCTAASSAPASTSTGTGTSTGTSTSTGTGTGTGTGPAGPALTTAQARAIFDGYVATTAKAARTNDSALALSVATGVQQSTLAATLKGGGVFLPREPSSSGSASSYGKPKHGQYVYRYGTPALYLPEPDGFPRFFVADATRTLEGSPYADGTVTVVGGTDVPLDGPVLMVFEQASVATPWLLASTSQLASGAALPRMATDENGYVPQVPMSSTGLLARPAVTGPLQAAVVDDGPASAAAKAVAAGPLTTAMYQGARERVEGLMAPRGDIYQWNLEGSHFPAFALRTASGGALVLYAMYLNSTASVPDVINKATPVRLGLPIAVPPSYLPLLAPGKAAFREYLEVQDLLSFAAIDPPAGPGKVTVIAIGGGANYAIGR